MSSGNGALPATGRNAGEILQQMASFGENDPDYKSGKTWSLVYYLGEEYARFLQDAYNMYSSTNGLNPLAFQSLMKFESEVVRMTADLLHGDKNVVGTMTSGGTESCLLAVKTYRDYGRSKRFRLPRPEMILPESAHVAWEKGAECFGVKPVRVPLSPDYRANVDAIRKKINRNTILIVGSAPQYPHGVIDPVAELGVLAQKHNIPLHIDACVGGYLLPFVEKLGYEVPLFDFRVPGVTSISADTHKYGYSAKGASTILYRNIDYFKHQIFVYENWPGGVFAGATLLGTRPGGAIAAAWAAMQALGEDGYLQNAKIIMETTIRLLKGIAAVPELEVIGRPAMSLFAYGAKAKGLSIYAVGDQMEARGWHVDRQHRPECLHAMVTPVHADIVDAYLSDLRESVAYVLKHPELATKGGAATYGMISQIPMRSLIKKNVLKMMLGMYGPDGKMIDVTNPDLALEGGEDKPDLATKAGLRFLQLKHWLARK